MKKSRIKELKTNLRAIENGGYIGSDDVKDIIELLDRVFPKTAVAPKDPAPMIGINPFRKESEGFVHDGDHLSVAPRDEKKMQERFYKLLNYRVEEGANESHE